MSFESDLAESVRAYIAVPPHIAAAAAACRYDLLHGPSYSLIPTAGIESFNLDSFASFASDLDSAAGAVTETYTGPIGDALRAFLADMPGTLYADQDGAVIGESEPDGEWIGLDGEPCDSDDDGAEWFQPESCYQVASRDIVTALFGPTIAREFS